MTNYEHTSASDDAPICLNHLRRGRSYVATTDSGQTARGIYLGIETAHGDRAILLATPQSITSVGIRRLTDVDPLLIAC